MFEFLKRKKYVGPNQWATKQIRFHQEQDGPNERKLKEALSARFAKSQHVLRAYLVRVDYGIIPDAFEVALCIKGTEDVATVRMVGEEFARLAGGDHHIDTLFMTDAQEEQVRAVAAPFYSS